MTIQLKDLWLKKNDFILLNDYSIKGLVIEKNDFILLNDYSVKGLAIEENVFILLNDYSIKGLVIQQNERFQFSLMSDNEIKRWTIFVELLKINLIFY